MKKILLLSCFLFATISLWSQNVGGGLQLGFNASQVDGDGVGGFNRAGFSVGGFVTYELQKNLHIRPEILFEQLGSATRQQLILSTNHISIPLLIQASIPISLDDGVQRIQVVAGPVIGILLSAKDFNDDVTASLNRTDFRITAGAAYRFSEQWSISLRYGYSLTSFVKVNTPLSAALLVGARAGVAHHYANFSLNFHLAE
ncbi:MAG: porin family protein [Bacteroidota bacterium]